jgi:hypothetical protein
MGEEEKILDVDGKPVGFGKCNLEGIQGLGEDFNALADDMANDVKQILGHYLVQKCIDEFVNIEEKEPDHTEPEKESLTYGKAQINYETGELVKTSIGSYICSSATLPVSAPFYSRSIWEYWVYFCLRGQVPADPDFKDYAYSNFWRIVKEMIYHKKRMGLAKSEGFRRHHEKRLKSLENTYKFSLTWNGNGN